MSIGHVAPRRAPTEPPAGGPVELLDPHERAALVEGYVELLSVDATTEPHLARAVRESLAHPGSMVRAQIAYGLLRALGGAHAEARALGVGIEYFHTASLLFDDLPAMDDARSRRGRACAHRIHGEATTILAALALINRGYALTWSVVAKLPASDRERARRCIDRSLGTTGILDGQARDLRFAGNADASAVLAVAERKTVPLVRLPLLLAAIAGGADEGLTRRLDRLSTLWGLSYQILDDFKDCLMDRFEAGKSTARDAILARPNLPLCIGAGPSMRKLGELIDEADEILGSLDGLVRACPALGRLQGRLELERERMSRRLAAGAGAGVAV